MDIEEENKFISYESIKSLDLKAMNVTWHKNQPDNVGDQDCLLISRGLLADKQCSYKCYFACKIQLFTSFTLDGVCKESVVDSHYVLQSGGVLKGYLKTEMKWNGASNQWEIWNLEDRTLAATMNQTNGFPLGTYQWYILDTDCADDNETRRLNLHYQVKRPGHFCCDDGICINSNFVCDGNINCEDGEDEFQCEMVRTSISYDKSRPPNKRVSNKVKVSSVSKYLKIVIK